MTEPIAAGDDDSLENARPQIQPIARLFVACARDLLQVVAGATATGACALWNANDVYMVASMAWTASSGICGVLSCRKMLRQLVTREQAIREASIGAMVKMGVQTYRKGYDRGYSEAMQENLAELLAKGVVEISTVVSVTPGRHKPTDKPDPTTANGQSPPTKATLH